MRGDHPVRDRTPKLPRSELGALAATSAVLALDDQARPNAVPGGLHGITVKAIATHVG